MVTGALVGWKASKPEIIAAGVQLGAMIDKFKNLNLELADGKCEYEKIELYKGAFKMAVLKAPGKKKKGIV